MESQTNTGSIFGYLTDPQILQKPLVDVIQPQFLNGSLPPQTQLTPEQKIVNDSQLKLLGKQIKRDCS